MLEHWIDTLSSGFLDSTPWVLAADVSLLQVWSTRLYNIMLVVLGLGFVIFVHELGHFLAAKTFGVKCEKFYVGFDVPIKIGPIRLPAKLFHFQWGETEYGIGIIPLGGYVKMLGQDDDPRRIKEEAERIRALNPNASPNDPIRVVLDPRSYPAKPVYARMIIISAGVVMNLISAVFMAAIAFGIGVPYEPAVIGEVVPGDPAWVNGIKPGDHIIQVGSTRDEQLSFNDMRQKAAFSGIRDSKADVVIALRRDGAESSLKFAGTMAHADPTARLKLMQFGFRNALITKVSSKAAFQEYLNKAGLSLGSLQPGDLIVGVDGTDLPINVESDIPLEYSLEQLTHPKLDKTVNLNVRRTVDKSTQDVVVELAPMPLKSLGIQFSPDKVFAIQKGSIAEKANVQQGDSLVAFNGKPIADGLTLPLIVAGKAGQDVSLELEHADKSRFTLQWKVPDQFQLSNAQLVYTPSGFELPGSGLTFRVSNVVQSVTPDSDAAKSGLAAGDIVKQFKLLLKTEEDKKFYEEVIGAKSLLENIPIDEVHSIQYLHELAQILKTGIVTQLHYERDGKINSCEVAVQNDPIYHWPDRGLRLEPLRKKYEAASFGQAMALGTKEVWKRLCDVAEFLQLVVTGKAFNAFGGPGTIAVTANEAASQGIASLLMFLTLLSANLAIVNFLPVPALDGGHMVFLAAEAVRGKPVDEELQMRLTLGGIVGLLCLMGWAIFNDYMHLSRYFGG